MKTTQQLFAYGTLNDKAIQKKVFGRKLTGKRDALAGYKVVAHSRLEPYKVALKTQNTFDRIVGRVYNVANYELYLADVYESGAYKRISIQLQSGIEAWTYIENSDGENEQ